MHRPVAKPAFDPHRIRRELTIDATVRGTVLITAAAAILIASAAEPEQGPLTWWLLLLVVGVWMLISGPNAKVVRQIPPITDMIAAGRASAGPTLAAAIRRRPLVRAVRLALYHRLAMLRHRQRRYAESAMICHAVLVECPKLSDQSSPTPTRPGTSAHTGERMRIHLLLMLVEARLSLGDLMGVYVTLVELHRHKLNLLELMQLQALQTRYELACGYTDRALERVREKVRLAEVMPVALGGAMHAMLAAAARQQNQPDLAHWLRRRTAMLVSHEQRSLITGLGYPIATQAVGAGDDRASHDPGDRDPEDMPYTGGSWNT